MKRKSKIKKRKAYAFTLAVLLISVYFYCGISAAEKTDAENKTKKPQKIILAAVSGENGEALCDSPLSNLCFYPGITYSEKDLTGRLYTYFDKEYREITEYDGAFFINEEKYSFDLKLKVGEKESGKVKFYRTVYLKNEAETKNEAIYNLIESFIKINKEKKNDEISLIFPDGSFSQFSLAADINLNDTKEKFFRKCENGVNLTSFAVISKLKNLLGEKGEATLILITGEKEPYGLSDGNMAFKKYFMINLLSPADITGKESEKSCYGGNGDFYFNIHGENKETCLLNVVKEINKNSGQ